MAEEIERPPRISPDNCPFWARIFEQGLEYGSGYIEPGFFVFGRQKQIPIPDHIKRALLDATTPHEMNAIIQKSRVELEAVKRENLDCDEGAFLMSAALTARQIPHQLVVGTTSDGYPHAYVIVGGEAYDPTGQGCGDRTYWVYAEYPVSEIRYKSTRFRSRQKSPLLRGLRGWFSDSPGHSLAARGRRVPWRKKS